MESFKSTPESLQNFKSLRVRVLEIMGGGAGLLTLTKCGKGHQNFASNVTLYPCQRSFQNHLERTKI